MIGHGGSSAGSYLTDPTSPIPSHCASIVATSILRVKWIFHKVCVRCSCQTITLLSICSSDVAIWNIYRVPIVLNIYNVLSCISLSSLVICFLIHLTLKLPGPTVGEGGSLTVAVA